MKTIVLLCGVARSGKTKTLKRFFNVSGRLKPYQRLERVVDDKKVYAFSLCAPQELVKEFCYVNEVIDKIEKRIQKFEEASHSQDCVLIIPFGIYARKGKAEINEQCILKPIDWLRAKGYRVFPVYLRKERTRYLSLKDALMNRITKHVIKSDKNYDRQARELETLIKNL